MKFRIVTNGREFSIERLSSYKKKVADAGMFSKEKYEEVPNWIACADLTNKSSFEFRADGLGPIIMNLVRKKYPTYDQAKDAIEQYLMFGEKENWGQVGEVFWKLKTTTMNNREIKFRIWFNEPSAPSQMIYPHIDDFIIDEDKNVIGQVFLLNSYQKGFEVNYKVVNLKEGLLKDEIMSLDDTWWDADNSVLMQYTGLKDKNGKELYEGDIIKHGNSTLTYLAEFSNGRFCASWEYEWGYVDSLRLVKDVPYGFEVIGNMFENPELLKSYEVEEVLF